MKTLIQLPGSGSASTPIVYVTRAQLNTLISGSSLVPGQYYGITNADIPLYGGTEIVIQAIKNNQLALEGEGIFYTPKYSTATGFGIWYSGGTYAAGNKVFWGGYVWTNLNGNTGTAFNSYVLDPAEWSQIAYNTTDYNLSVDTIHYDYPNDRIIYRKDRSDNVVSVSNEVIESFLMSYGLHPIKAFQWGNPAQASNNGTYENQIVDSGYECINFRGIVNSGNKLSGRSRIEQNIMESCYFTDNIVDQESIIAYNTFGVIGGVSYVRFNELKMFSSMTGNNLDAGSTILYNIIEQYAKLEGNTLISGAIENNKISGYKTSSGFQSSQILGNLISSSRISDNTLDNGSVITLNQLSTNSKIINNILSLGVIRENFLTINCDINGNTMSFGSLIGQNNLQSNCFIQINNLTTGGYIYDNTLTNGSSIAYCTLSGDSAISSNYITGSSSMSYLVLKNLSGIGNNQIDAGSTFIQWVLDTATLDFSNSGILSTIYIGNINATMVYVVDDISAATDIYGSYSKTLFVNSGSANRLMYYDAADNQIIVNVNA